MGRQQKIKKILPINPDQDKLLKCYNFFNILNKIILNDNSSDELSKNFNKTCEEFYDAVSFTSKERKYFTEYFILCKVTRNKPNQLFFTHGLLPQIGWLSPDVWGTYQGTLSIKEIHSVFLTNPFVLYNLTLSNILDLSRKFQNIHNQLLNLIQLLGYNNFDFKKCYSKILVETTKDLSHKEYRLRPINDLSHLEQNTRMLASMLSEYNLNMDYMSAALLDVEEKTMAKLFQRYDSIKTQINQINH